jgi:membrane associated rhomboid family serine protease
MQLSSRPSGREPVFNLPTVVLVSLAALVAIHALRTFVLSDETDFELLIELAAIPARWTLALAPARATDVVASAGGTGADEMLRAAMARYVVDDSAHPWTIVTYAFLHGSWTHIAMNGVWFAAFGSPVARRLGAARFLALALACAIAGAAAHALVHPLSVLPMIGASAAVSGMMAAAARFIFAPPRGRGWMPIPVHRRELQSLPRLLGNRSAALFLGVWFVTNFAFGALAAPLGAVDAGIAWEAHVGGFLAGLLLMPALDRAPEPEPIDGADLS